MVGPGVAASRPHPRMLGFTLLAAGLLLLTLLPAGAAGQVVPQEDDSTVAPSRIKGLQRFETAARIADRTFDDTDTAILVTGVDYPDALAGSYAAGWEGAPILLVERDRIPDATLGMLNDLGVSRVVLLGGRAAIGVGVEAALDERGFPFERIAGEDRYETAVAIARRYGHEPGEPLDGDRAALLASGESFPDALSAGPLATRARLPLLLTPRDRALPAVDDVLEDLDIERVVVVGGEEAVSSGLVEHYEEAGYAVERFAGATRDETAAVVADNALARFDGFSERLVLLARGDSFPDALAASVHGAVVGAPILLSATPDTLGAATAAWLEDRCPDVERIRALGGDAALSSATLQAAVDAAGACVRPVGEVARFTTELLGVPDRTHNIHLAADYIDGDVIAAGESYSLNQGIGRRTTARGFRLVEDGCIGGDGQPVDCVGGGTSQVATTFLNAAWFTGIDIPEFRPHTIWFERYPVCHEATLTWGALDVVVRNDSPYDIVIDTFYSAEIIGVRFISQPWAEVESWAEPADPPAAGSFTSSCGRTITYPDGSTESESYTWIYQAVGF